MSFKELPIENKYGLHYKLDMDKMSLALEDLDKILDEYLKKIDISDDRLLLSRRAYGILVSNAIEGMKDDAFLIVDQLKKYEENSSFNSKRIINLYKAFLFIAEGHLITADTLNELYLTITSGILEGDDEARMREAFSMGRVSRNGKVYIWESNGVANEQMDSEDAERMMRGVLSFIKDEESNNASPAYNFMISELLHFMIAYIHPYYDGNGRTSRCVSSWYTLNNGLITGELGNRGIEINKTLYYKAIEETIKYRNVNYFLNLMMKFLKLEIKKEYLIKCLEEYTGYKLTPEQYIIMHCIILTRGEKSYLHFLKNYRTITGKKASKNFYKEVFEPLIEKGFIVNTGSTKRVDNFMFSLPEEIEENIKVLKIYDRPHHL